MYLVFCFCFFHSNKSHTVSSPFSCLFRLPGGLTFIFFWLVIGTSPVVLVAIYLRFFFYDSLAAFLTKCNTFIDFFLDPSDSLCVFILFADVSIYRYFFPSISSHHAVCTCRTKFLQILHSTFHST